MWANYHTHSQYCDGKNSIDEMVDQAHELISLGFSSHAPLPFACAWAMPPDRLDDYLHTLNQSTQDNTKIQVYKGLEVDYIPGVIAPATFSRQLDFTIGSIHFVEQLPDGRHWEIDGAHVQFAEGLADIFHGDVRQAVSRYFELTREMIEMSPPTIVGHLDKIKIQNRGRTYFDENEKWYREQVVQTLDAMTRSSCILEVNTRGIYQRKSATTYPSPWIVELALERGIPLTLSSDAHLATDLTRAFDQAGAMLHDCGCDVLSVLVDGGWRTVKFDADGIYI